MREAVAKEIKEELLRKKLQQRYSTVGKLSDGFIAVCSKKNGLWGFVDENGLLRIDCKYASAENFQNGLSIVGVNIGKQNYNFVIDKNGKALARFCQTRVDFGCCDIASLGKRQDEIIIAQKGGYGKNSACSVWLKEVDEKNSVKVRQVTPYIKGCEPDDINDDCFKAIYDKIINLITYSSKQAKEILTDDFNASLVLDALKVKAEHDVKGKSQATIERVISDYSRKLRLFEKAQARAKSQTPEKSVLKRIEMLDKAARHSTGMDKVGD